MKYILCPKCLKLKEKTFFTVKETVFSLCESCRTTKLSSDYFNSDSIVISKLNNLEYSGSIIPLSKKEEKERTYYLKQVKTESNSLSEDEFALIYNDYIDNLDNPMNSILISSKTPRTEDDEWHETKRRIRAKSTTCKYCETTEVRSVDHYIPLTQGGSNDDDNLVISCDLCNLIKNHYHPSLYEEFISSHKYLVIKANQIKDELFYLDVLNEDLTYDLKKYNDSYLDNNSYPDQTTLEYLSIRSTKNYIENKLVTYKNELEVITDILVKSFKYFVER